MAPAGVPQRLHVQVRLRWNPDALAYHPTDVFDMHGAPFCDPFGGAALHAIRRAPSVRPWMDPPQGQRAQCTLCRGTAMPDAEVPADITFDGQTWAAFIAMPSAHIRRCAACGGAMALHTPTAHEKLHHHAKRRP